MQTKRSTCVLIKKGNISTLNGGSPKLVDVFTYLGSSTSSTENDISMRQAKALTAIDRLSILWKSDRRKSNFFQQQSCQFYYMDAPQGRWQSILRRSLMGIAQECYKLYWTIPGSNIPIKHHLYGHLSPISKTIQIWQTRHAGHRWRSKGELKWTCRC